MRVDVTPHGAAACSIALRVGDRWYDLMAFNDREPQWTTIANIAGVIPRGGLLPRSRGLEIARTAATDGPEALRTAHSWRPVPSWVADRGEYLVRDIAEALLDQAGDEFMTIAGHADRTSHPPAGVQRLAYLLGFHNEAMSSGLGSALTETPAESWGEAINACDDLGLTDVAGLLRRLDPGEPDLGLTTGMDSEYIQLTMVGGWHGDDAIRTALRRRVEQTPPEYGIHETPPPPPTARYDELLPRGSGAFLQSLAELTET
ncbi:hypothetical protein OHA72_57610 [Dactylosporangium sp. NBC_01737]|uniref:hypothetical protein n=1 Tax=Dactylosporangium sp. NBC_01737 TaxID=2975959 RepID=UPI002E1223D1|nr:hypothetical protein OHA72_57610 [Dactylosporangium sp. NBC_01737]